MQLSRTEQFSKIERKFFRKHQNLIEKYSTVLKTLQQNPFEKSLKTHKLQGNLKEFYSCSLNYEYRIIITIKIEDDKIILINIGTHGEVY